MEAEVKIPETAPAVWCVGSRALARMSCGQHYGYGGPC